MDPTYLASLNNTYELELLNDRWQIILIVWYSSTAILSLISNILAIFILITSDRFMSEIWKYLVNLSVADILMAMFSIPFTYTSFMLGTMDISNMALSIDTISVIGFDRYFAIIHPFNHPIIYLKTHRLLIIIVIWITGVMFSFIQLIQTRAVPFRYRNQILYDCKELWGQNEGQYYTIFLFIITFGLPISILIFVYASIGLHLWRNKIPGNPEMIRDSAKWQQKIKIIKMLIMIVLIFVLCWLPIHIHSFIVWFHPIRFQTYLGYLLYVISFFICHWLAMAHSFLNPFIYGFMSENFKTNFHRLFCQTTTTTTSAAMKLRKKHKKQQTKRKCLLSSNTIERGVQQQPLPQLPLSSQQARVDGNNIGGVLDNGRDNVVMDDIDLDHDHNDHHIAELDNPSTTTATTTNIMMITANESIISSSISSSYT
ncbi:hypothetical protein DERP_012367 [Dermatophagoides pteronyssinus]|uniref:G-protein coupled receptors family 1 profile domain-containing protein n=1 Tax=Dermatophagoides pteronyssinus TaxID=6956 RepID=A0ABQ8IUL2_DERPT|nr:hypothetical protein DERP_012367 [Dermatophagoides pteronyssinus]